MPVPTPQHSDAGKAADYARVADAISYLQAARQKRQQPTLDDLAAFLDLSPSHTQRLFTRWAGISPKRFLQHLTLEDAKRRIDRTADLLSLAIDSGLSGPGRLHDLFVTMEALSPGEFKRAAAGLEIHYGVGVTPFGQARIAWCQRGICRLDFLEPKEAATVQPPDDRSLSLANWVRDDAGATALLGQVFRRDGQRADGGLALWVAGSNFQIQVWRALLSIPQGGLLSYQKVAQMIGKPSASRAVGNANATNPVAYLIPCHRVLRGTGEIGAYRWGLPRMVAMVGLEGARDPSQ